MSLTEYKRKRKFSQTTEPGAKNARSGKELHFVVQKHHATNLHYDFRLELKGSLKSWAVPKGPSMNPEEKRLAIMVEDHPLAYQDFEGVIPEGNYGAGEVIIWDKGTYEPASGNVASRADMEKDLSAQLKKGALKIMLHGTKLKGEFGLVQLKNNPDHSWLLVKAKDEFASAKDITKKEESVVSGKTIQKLAAGSGNKKKKKADSEPAARRRGKPEASADAAEGEAKGAKTPFPALLKPMLASLAEGPFDNPEWLFEIKWDGYRAIAYKNGNKIDLRSRNNLSLNKKYPPVLEGLEQLPGSFVADGEIVCLDKNGVPDFQLLQGWQKNGKGRLVYYLFDLLWRDGHLLTEKPLTERKKILESFIPPGEAVAYSDYVLGKGKEFFKAAAARGLEGIMGKKRDSIYVPGYRSSSWLKIKAEKRQEAVIAGFTRGRGTRSYFGALILGIHKNGEFVYVGHSGSGFTADSRKDLAARMNPLIVSKCPFATTPRTNMPGTWIKPALVCEIKFTSWTRDGHLRHPIYEGLREDKKVSEVTIEESVPHPKNKKAFL